MARKKSKIVFLGTPEFAIPVLNSLIKNNLKPALVITQPDKPAGRDKKLAPPPIKQVAIDNNIPIAQPANKKELKEIFTKVDFEVACLIAYGMIIPKVVLDQPKSGFLNIHPSLLPKYRGPSPIQTAIMNQEKETGVSIIQLVEKVDAGPIVAKESIAIKPTDTTEVLDDKLGQLGADLLVKILPDYLAGKIKLVPQNEAEATYTKQFSREDGQINWQKKAFEIQAQFRAFYPWPGIFTYLGKKRLKIADLSVTEGDFSPTLTPGEVFSGPNQAVLVKCGDGAIKLNLLQIEGKKEMTAEEFLLGHQDFIGKVLS